MSDDDDQEETEFVQLLVQFGEVFVYKVPPLTSVQSGHRAETWGLEKPFATSSMKVLAKGDVIMLQIFSIDKPGQLVAACPIALAKDTSQPEAKPEYWVEPVKDSARYFVVRMVDAKAKKQALLGVGFRERNSAFEFQEALNHHFKRVMRLRGVTLKPEGENIMGGEEEEQTSQTAAVTKSMADLSLRKPIKLNIPLKKDSEPAHFDPPQSSIAHQSQVTTSVSKADATLDVDDEEWGDFQ